MSCLRRARYAYVVIGVSMKFNPDDIIRLAEANPGFGFKRFIAKLTHGKVSRNTSQVMRLFDIHRAETGVDLYAELQDTSRRRMVTMAEFKAITGISSPPSGWGRSGGGRTPKPNRKRPKEEVRQVMVPLEPQEFNWLDIPETGSIQTHTGAGQTNHIQLVNSNVLLRLHGEEMNTPEQISEYMGISLSWVRNFLDLTQRYDDSGVLEDYLRVYEFLFVFEQYRGAHHHEDELMADLRGIFKEYISEPEESEPPSNDDLVWVFNQLAAEFGEPLFDQRFINTLDVSERLK